MADTKLSNLPAIPTGDIDNNVLLYVVDVTGGNISSKVTRSALYLDIANVFTKGQTISPVSLTGLIINPASAPTGSSSSFHAGLSIASGTVAFATTPQTGDYNSARIDQATLTNPSSGTIPNAASLKIIGAPIASTNVTITNNYALWVAAGTTLLQATTIATTLLVQGQTTHSTTTNTGIIINPPTAPTGSASEFVATINTAAGTVGFITTAQTGDFISSKFGQATLTNPSSGSVTNATTLKIVGAPIASTNVTITNSYSLWVLAGISKFDGPVTMTSSLTVFSFVNTISALSGTTGSVAIDFSVDQLQTVSLTGNITFTTSNLVAGKSKTIKILCDGTNRTFTFPGWIWLGTSGAPTTILANKTAILTLTSFSTTDGSVVAAYSVQS